MLKILVPAIGIIVLITAGLRSTQHAYRLWEWHNGGELHSSIRFVGDSTLVFTNLVRLDSGDLLFLYTDGLSEAENPEGDMYDEERVEEFVVRNRDVPLGEMVERLAIEVEEFMNGMERKDDLTLLVARISD